MVDSQDSFKEEIIKEIIFNLAHGFGGFSLGPAGSSAPGLKPGWNTISERLGGRKSLPPPKGSQEVEGDTQRTRPRKKHFLSKACP